jgi:hypothetical protein
MFIQVFIYFAETLYRAILDCKNYFHICADFIDDYSILISGWIDETIVNAMLQISLQREHQLTADCLSQTANAKSN